MVQSCSNGHITLDGGPNYIKHNAEKSSRETRKVSTVRAPVFGQAPVFRHLRALRKNHGSYYLDEWIIITLNVAGFLHPAIFWYFHHSSDKSGLKVADCTVQSAKYWCFYGTIHNLHPIISHSILQNWYRHSFCKGHC